MSDTLPSDAWPDQFRPTLADMQGAFRAAKSQAITDATSELQSLVDSVNTKLAAQATQLDEQSAQIAAQAAALKSQDAAIAWRQIGDRITVNQTAGYASGVVNIILPLPTAGFRRFQVEWENVTPVSAGGAMICRTSADGVNFYQGNSDYNQFSFSNTNAVTSSNIGDYSYIGLTPTLATTAPCMGTLTMAAQSDHTYQLTGRALLPGSAWWSQMSNGNVVPNANAYNAAILLGMTVGFQNGTFRLLGAY